jgi:hypothetical protein
MAALSPMAAWRSIHSRMTAGDRSDLAFLAPDALLNGFTHDPMSDAPTSHGQMMNLAFVRCRRSRVEPHVAGFK